MDELARAFAASPGKFITPLLGAGAGFFVGVTAAICAWKDSWPIRLSWRRGATREEIDAWIRKSIETIHARAGE